MISSTNDIQKFINDKSFKKIFVLCGMKSFVTSGAKIFLDKLLNNKEIKLFYKNSELPILPQELRGTFDTKGWFRIYINGVFITPNAYTYTFDGSINRILFKLDNTQAFESGGEITYILDSQDEVSVTGKFIEL